MLIWKLFNLWNVVYHCHSRELTNSIELLYKIQLNMNFVSHCLRVQVLFIHAENHQLSTKLSGSSARKDALVLMHCLIHQSKKRNSITLQKPCGFWEMTFHPSSVKQFHTQFQYQNRRRKTPSSPILQVADCSSEQLLKLHFSARGTQFTKHQFCVKFDRSL